MNFNKNNKFDFKNQIETINGELMEKVFNNFITSNKIVHEVKSEHKSKWCAYGNIYLEHQQYLNGQWVYSGISVTEADVYTHVLKDEDFEFLIPIMLPMKYLKDRIKYLLDNNYATLSSKPYTDNGTATRGILVPLQYLYITPKEIDCYNKEKEQRSKIKLKEYIESIKNNDTFA